jgi:hypothetical protein
MGMRVGIFCETSGVVRRAFAARGHDAWSIDPEDIRDEWVRRAVISEAEARYGRRGAR